LCKGDLAFTTSAPSLFSTDLTFIISPTELSFSSSYIGVSNMNIVGVAVFGGYIISLIMSGFLAGYRCP
ncbi:MAG: hypothetical protein P8Y28_13450, partial [Gammaproteobacteria bacterium]